VREADVPSFELVGPPHLTLGSAAESGPTHEIGADGTHTGFEPSIAGALAARLGLEVRWVVLEWWDLYPALEERRIDAILYNQSVTPDRMEKAAFTPPYGVFHESVMTRRDSGIRSPADLRGKRVGALVATTNMELATAVDGAEVVEYAGSVASFMQMVEDVRTGVLDALVDDEIYLAKQESAELHRAFTVRTGNAYGMASRLGEDLSAALATAMAEVRDSGELQRIWEDSFPGHPYERPVVGPVRSQAEMRALLAGPANVVGH
jgi:polar amino acid transport system substrate-binding protein